MTTTEPSCPQCFGAGWVLDAKLDMDPTTLELIPCIYPPCPYSARPVAVLCLYGEWTNPVLHPQTGHVMSLSRIDDSRWGNGVVMNSVISSNIDKIGYNFADRQLHVVMKDERHYVYDDVPPGVYVELMLADSKGSFLNRTLSNPRHINPPITGATA